MSHFKSYSPSDLPVAQFHGLLLSAVAPRPIAFASTIDKEGHVNLSPFSFFNVFGANPATLIFSPARRVRNNTIKHTLENVKEVPEVVINIVNYSIVEQMSLSSTEYEKGVNEFVKAGLTEQASEVVRPPRVLESPAQFECEVKQIIETGNEGGAGNLIICEVKKMHISENVMTQDGKIDVRKIDLVARMGGNYYCRANGEALFEVEKPLRNKGIGVDALPEPIRMSKILSGNTLGKLANVEKIPSLETLPTVELSLTSEEEKHQHAEVFAQEGKVLEAWAVLLG